MTNPMLLTKALTISIPYGAGSCSSNYVFESGNQLYCITCYHGFLKMGLPFKYSGDRETGIPLKINGQTGGILEFGRLNAQLDFGLIRLLDVPMGLETAIPISKLLLGCESDEQAFPKAKATNILLPNARHYAFDVTIPLKDHVLKPGDSGMLFTQNEGSKRIALGWALGNTTQESHLLPYHHINEFLNTVMI